MTNVEHYLITITADGAYHAHAYLMTNDRECVYQVANELLEYLKKEGMTFRLPMILLTTLAADGREIVRDVIAGECPEAKKHWETATTFHRTNFIMPEEHPGNHRLMELH